MSYFEVLQNISHIAEENILKNTKKDAFLAFKEAFNNSLEAIKDKNAPEKTYKNGNLIISIHTKKNITQEEILDFITIKDNGTGFIPAGFKRFCKYIDSSKGYNNKGTGRFFLLKSFKKLVYDSIYQNNEDFYHVCFEFSSAFPSKDMFIRIVSEEKTTLKETGTSLCLYPFDSTPDDVKDYKFFLDVDILKKSIIDKFLLEFVLHSNTGLPKILIQKYDDKNNLINELQIEKKDFPTIDKKDNMEVAFCKINYDNQTIEKTDNSAEFQLYISKSNQIDKNQIILTCNNQNAERLNFQSLLPSDTFPNEDRLLLFVKSEYLDNPQNSNEERLKFNLTTRSEIQKILKKQDSLQSDFNFSNEIYLFKDDIEKKANEKTEEIYPEIRRMKKDKSETATKLKERFLISDKVFDKVVKKMNINTSPETFLVEFYKAEAEILAKADITISNKIDEVSKIDTSDDNYMETLDKLSTEIVEMIPLQNRNNLAQYVARRNLVLKAFDNILNHMKDDEIKERHLHNLFLVKNKENTYEDSNLWMLNEDFIYFTGKSEERLCDYKIGEEKVFRDEFSDEESKYLQSLGENRKLKRPDILLFPEENKCIIIEFKNIDVNVSDHLSQINKYAYWLRNFSNPCFKFTQFYGYLIGEAIEPRDIRAADGEYKTMYNGLGLFKPKANIPCDNDEKQDGELYMEVLPYSALLERAITRNKIFIEKLGIESSLKTQNK